MKEEKSYSASWLPGNCLCPQLVQKTVRQACTALSVTVLLLFSSRLLSSGVIMAAGQALMEVRWE